MPLSPFKEAAMMKEIYHLPTLEKVANFHEAGRRKKSQWASLSQQN
jgi:hypothetical protein